MLQWTRQFCQVETLLLIGPIYKLQNNKGVVIRTCGIVFTILKMISLVTSLLIMIILIMASLKTTLLRMIIFIMTSLKTTLLIMTILIILNMCGDTHN